MEKIGFVSLGCSKNLIDTEVMLGILRDRHMEITEDLPQADIIIVNTCTFIEKAKQESIDTILQAARYKTEGKCKILIVTGCLSQQYKEDLMKEMPEIDALLGTGSWDRIWEAIDTVKKGRKACFMDDVSHLYNQNTSRLRTTPKYSAYVKIGEGCNNGCSFCIIPHVRGKLYSRPVDSVVAEVQQLAADGVKEVNLIAQDTTSYGVDLAGHSLLPELLRQLVKIDGIRWIRLFYLYPHYFTDELMDLIVKEEKNLSLRRLAAPAHFPVRLAAHEPPRFRSRCAQPHEEALQSRPQADPALDVHRRLPWRNGRRIPGTL